MYDREISNKTTEKKMNAMKKIVLIPDSFKGTMSSETICNIMADKIHEYYPQCRVVSIPVADGGEGTVNCFLKAVGGRKVELTVNDPFFVPVGAFYGVLPDEQTAVIEVASAIGLPIVENRKDPLRASSFGVGELIYQAISSGCRKLLIGLGGSSTNDGGAGMACALGAKFYNREGKEFCPTGGSLNEITRMDLSEVQKITKGCEIIAICDVENSLCGKDGASAVFGPQKGATLETVQILDANLEHLSEIVKRTLNMDVSVLRSGGAAGGLGAGVVAFLGGKLVPGIDIILNTVDFDSVIHDADLILTGEGKIDAQSARGKVISGVAARAFRQKKPVIAVVGDIDPEAEKVYRLGVTSILSINKKAVPFETARKTCKQDLAFTVDALLRVLKTFEK